MTRSEFDKLSAGWFVAQTFTGPCPCDTCESVTDILADAAEELMAFDEMVAAEMEAVADLLDRLKANAQMNLMLLTNSHPMCFIPSIQFLITQ